MRLFRIISQDFNLLVGRILHKIGLILERFLQVLSYIYIPTHVKYVLIHNSSCSVELLKSLISALAD